MLSLHPVPDRASLRLELEAVALGSAPPFRTPVVSFHPRHLHQGGTRVRFRRELLARGLDRVPFATVTDRLDAMAR
jgi:hypothetical protein